MRTGACPSVVSTLAPICASGRAIRVWSRAESDSSPTSSNVASWPARIPDTSRSTVPALPQSSGPSGARSPRSPTPWTVSSSPSSSTSTPRARATSIADSVSAARPKPRMRLSPSATAPSRTARCEIPFTPGTAIAPRSAAAGSTFIEHRRDDHAVSLRLEQVGGAASLVLAGHEERQRPAPLRRHVLELEVLNVDPLGAERLRHACKHAWAVGHVDAEPLQRARVVVRALEHPSPVPRRLADPAGQEAGVALGERDLDLLDPAPVLGERVADGRAVVEEDVDPDPWARAGDARH